ncbi:MAG: methionyl-tRNA formyltransferase [Candidatus Saccharibacteria bacterium]|nr:methionyl-tRNA formyltransferase [Candidatus Saccharibacteria bacterium]
MVSGDKAKTPVVFFGTGPVAAKSLELLLKHCDVETVITKPKPPGHRGNFPVLDVAQGHELPITEVSSKAELSQKLKNSGLSSPVGVLIDFGIIVSRDVIDYFPLGIINSHFSRLPQWRGADPISFAILSGQKSTGVTLMLIDEGMDTGKILVQKSQLISSSDTTGSLTDKLINLSDNLLKSYLPKHLSRQLTPRNQPHPERVTYSRKLTKEDGLIDWNKPAEVLEREIRAFHEWPKSYTKLAGKDVVITSAKVSSFSGKPGTVVLNKNELHLCCGQNSLQLLKLTPAGKKEMTAEAFLAGHRDLLNK